MKLFIFAQKIVFIKKFKNMKKLAIILICFVFCLSLTSKAQDDPGFKPFSFGLKAVPSISFAKSEVKDFKNGSPSLNFGYGLIAEFNFAPNYGFLTGIEINDNSANIDYLPNVSNVYYFPESDTNRFYMTSRKYSVKYLNIPLVLKLKTNEIGFLKYYGQFGVDAGFRLKARAKDEGAYRNTTTSTKNDVIVDDDVNLIRMGLNVGAGVEWNLAGSTSLVIGLNYNNGFTNFLKKESKYLYVDKNTGNDARLNQNALNSYVTLTVGILF